MNSGDSPLDLGAIATLPPLAKLQVPQTDGAYDIASEKPLSHAFFDPAVSNALDLADDSLMKLRQVLRKVRQKCPDAEGLRELEENCMKQLPAVVRRLAVVGDSGQGKSSLMNSLLHVPGIAHTCDSGEACTSVVIEYHQKRKHQTSPIDITVEFYFGEALEEIVTEMAWSCRVYRLQKEKESDQTLTESEKEETDLKNLERESEAAAAALTVAFGHHEGFTEEFLYDDLSEEGYDRVNQQLLAWAHAIEWPSSEMTTTQGGSGVWQASVNDARECTGITRDIMTGKLWPFTKVIK
jgi:hypothetical protein